MLAGTTGLSRFVAGDGSDAGYLDYNHNGDKWSIKTAGSERLEINGSGIAVTGTLGVTGQITGAAGFNTYGLHLTGSTTIQGVGKIHLSGAGTAIDHISINNGPSNNGSTVIGNDRSAGGGLATGSLAYSSVFGSVSATAAHIMTNNSVKMTVLSGGNVGIGTTGPDKKFHVEESVSGYSEIIRVVNSHASGKPYMALGGPGDDDGIIMGYHNAGNYGWISHTGLDPVGNGAGLFMTTTGNVGIGTPTPDTTLDVHGSIHLHSDSDVEFAFGAASHGEYWGWIYDGAGSQDLRLRTYDGAWYDNVIFFDRSTRNIGIGTSDTYGRKFVVEGTGDLMMLRSTNGGAGGAQLDLVHDSSSKANDDSIGIINFTTDDRQYASIKGVAHNHSSGHGLLQFGVRQNTSTYNHTAMTIDENGQVGIGTDSPDAKFEVEWTGTHASTDSIARITAPIYPALEFYSTNTNSNNRNWKISSVYNAYGTLEFLKSSVANGVPQQTVMSMDKDGNVGIGTATPGSYAAVQSTLEVKNTSHGAIAINAGTNSLGMLAFAQNGTHKWSVEMENSATPYLSFNEAGTQRMTIDAGGKVGIGTTDPGAPLTIQTNDSTTNDVVNTLMIKNLSTGTTTTGFGGEIRFQAKRNNGDVQNTGRIASVAEVNSGTNISSGLGFWTGTVGVINERMRISYDGKIAIGNNIPLWSGAYGGGIFLKGNNVTGDRYARICTVDSTGAAINNGLTVNNDGSTTIDCGQTYALNITGNGSGLRFSTGSNQRIYWNTHRALEGAADGSIMQIGEGFVDILTQGKPRVDSSSQSRGTGGRHFREGGKQGTGTYTLFTNGSSLTQGAGIVRVNAIYSTPSGAGTWKYKISGNRAVYLVDSETSGYGGSVPSLAWSGAALQISNSNSSVYYHVSVELFEMGSSSSYAWLPTWGDFPGIA